MGTSLYLRKGLVIIPTSARTPSGLHTDIEPIDAVPVSETTLLIAALEANLLRGTPSVPEPDRTKDDPERGVRKYAGVNTWTQFEKGAFTWTISEFEGVYEIYNYKKNKGLGWLIDRKATIALPPGTQLREAVVKAIQIVQEKAKATGMLPPDFVTAGN